MMGTGESIEEWEVDDMMRDGDKNQDGSLDYEGDVLNIFQLFSQKLTICFRVCSNDEIRPINKYPTESVNMLSFVAPKSHFTVCSLYLYQ